jgi:hypothetical protein
MQIAFPTNTPPTGDAGNVYPVSINGYTFNVYSKTFLGLGGDDARKYVKAFNYDTNNGGAKCYASTATPNNTNEKSGIQLYPSNQVTPLVDYPFPANVAYLNTPWTTVPIGSLLLVSPPAYDSTICSNMYDTIEGQVTSLPRNNYGTFNDGSVVTMASFKADIQTSNAPFVGIDGFFYTANGLEYTPSTSFSSSTFQTRLHTYCTTGSVAPNPNAQNVCPNGNFMNTYLFGDSGLFTSTTAIFAGVQNPVVGGETVLTWTRGYLLLKYAN